jgi:hypothetical protein
MHPRANESEQQLFALPGQCGFLLRLQLGNFLALIAAKGGGIERLPL